MTITIGDRIPAVALMEMVDGKPAPVAMDGFCKGRRVALFAVPGAFTPTCSAKHLPGFVSHHDALMAKGIGAIACVSVNDVFVMDAWGRSQGVAGKIHMLADGNGAFAEAMGLTMDGHKFGMGQRSRRYSMVVEDGTIRHLNVEEPGAFDVSSAEYMLAQIS